MANTIVTITSTNQSYTLPGTHTVEGVVSAYSQYVQGLDAMQSSVETLANGDTKITFSPRTGTKG